MRPCICDLSGLNNGGRTCGPTPLHIIGNKLAFFNSDIAVNMFQC